MLEAVLLSNLVVLGLWVGLRLIGVSFERQVRDLQRGLPQPDPQEDPEVTKLRDLLDSARRAGPIAGRSLLAQARVQASMLFVDASSQD